jgi:kynureninase
VTGIDLGPFPDAAGFDQAVALDEADPLSGFRQRYHIADPGLIYLDGNSLGRLPDAVRPMLDKLVLEEWGDGLIRSWNERWWNLPEAIGDRLAPLIGASPGEVIISDSTSVNLFKLAMGAVTASGRRGKIVTDDANFPADVYVLRGVAETLGVALEVVATDSAADPIAALAPAINEDTVFVSLSHTAFKTGYTYDLAKVTRLAHESGAMVLWDLSHSVGVVPIDLGGSGADLAVGCTYKYLNGGPGSPAFLYVPRELQPALSNPIHGWWGHAQPFAFDLEFRPTDGIRRFHTGTMPILSMAAVEAGIDDVTAAGIDRLRSKSVSLSQFFISQWEEHLVPLGFALASPRDPRLRGSHVSLSHPEAWPNDLALIEIGKVIPDFRAPDNLRFGLAPLYNTHVEVHTAVQRIRAIVGGGVHAAFQGREATVT